MDIVNLFTTSIYLIIFILSFRSFVVKKNFRFHISLNITFAFLIWTSISFIKSFDISQELKNILFSFDVYAMFLIFNSAAKIKSATNKKPNLTFRKIINIIFLLSVSSSIFFIGNSFLQGNQYLIELNKYIINLVFYILIIIHLDNNNEFKWLKISMILFSFKYILAFLGLYINIPYYFVIIGISLRSIGFIILLFSLHNLYVNSIKAEKEKQLN